MLVTISPDVHEELGLALGALDDDPGAKPGFHVYVRSKAPWYDLTDSLPRFATTPEAEEPSDPRSAVCG